MIVGYLVTGGFNFDTFPAQLGALTTSLFLVVRGCNLHKIKACDIEILV